MSRLTNETLENAIKTYKTVIESCNGVGDDDYCPILDKVTVELLEELKEYRHLEEQGLLLKLPCKVGAKVYHIAFNYKTTRKEKIVETTFSLEMLEDYKKWWFLTKAEAEKALAEMEK